MKPYYEDDSGITIYCGDCREVLPHLAASSVDATIADPPYGTTANAWDSVIPFDDMWRELKRLNKSAAPIVLFGAQPFTSALVMSNPKWYRHSWVWEKDKAANILNANRMPLDVAEDVLVFGATLPNYTPQMESCKPYKHKNRNVVSTNFGNNAEGYDPNGYTTYTHAHPRNVLYFAKDGALHPTQKPLALLRYFILTYTNPGDVILDFTMGSGTTLRAAKDLGRRAIGIEISEHFCSIAVDRLSQNVLALEAL